jgi:hypothetical protein
MKKFFTGLREGLRTSLSTSVTGWKIISGRICTKIKSFFSPVIKAITKPYVKFKTKRHMWTYRWGFPNKRYFFFNRTGRLDSGWDDLHLLSMIVKDYPTQENRALLYKEIMGNPYVSRRFKLRYWWDNKILFRLVHIPMAKYTNSISKLGKL